MSSYITQAMIRAERAAEREAVAGEQMRRRYPVRRRQRGERKGKAARS